MKYMLICFLCFTTLGFSQRVENLGGGFKLLNGISQYNLVFDYSNITVPKYDSEEEFLKEKVLKYNTKRQGSGDEFEKRWFSDREDFFEPKFIERFNEQFKKKNISVGKNDINCEYTMKVHTVFLYTGYGNPAFTSSSKVSAIISIYKTNEPENLILKVKYNEVYGKSPKKSDQTYRISKAYGELGKRLAIDIRKNYSKTKNVTESDSDIKSDIKTNNNFATVYVIRPKKSGSDLNVMKIYEDDKLIGYLSSNTYLTWKIRTDNGNVVIRSEAEGSDVVGIIPKPEKTYFIKQSHNTGWYRAIPKIELIEEAEAKKLLKKCKLVEPKRID